jgi:uncharacterized protein (TIGR00255 family)
MIKSMTGYGTATVQSPGGRSYTIEIKSVNHRYCDVSIKLPNKLAFLEQDLKKQVKDRFERGRFDMYVSLDDFGKEAKQVTFDHALAAQYVEKLRELGAVLNLDARVDLLSLTRLPDVLKVEQAAFDQEEAQQHLSMALTQAFAHLEQMRGHEGQMLEQDLTRHLERIRAIVVTIQTLSQASPERYRVALEERVKRLTDGVVDIDPARFAQELVFFCDKIDISEEITRLNGHIDHFFHLCRAAETVGRKLDFLLQEMNREINTIGSKSNHSEISQQVVEVKAILEKIREQVQNVE